MKTVCEKNKCTGCMACIDACPRNAIQLQDELSNYNMTIDLKKCINCNACHNVCPNVNPVTLSTPKNWYQGWIKNDELRKECSSGGAVAAVAAAFIKAEGSVYSCLFKEGAFVFEGAETEDELKKFIGSKYVKSNPAGIYQEIKCKLKAGKKVLFIGLPCQVAAVKNFVGIKLEKNLYTGDLICHGTPSPQVLEQFLKQYGYSLERINEIQFRKKTRYQLRIDKSELITKGVSDRYSIAFLNSLIHTDNCYECPYAQKERVSDITFGDSWGSCLAVEEQMRGISLLLCQSEKGLEMLEKSNLQLEEVDLEKAMENNHQLTHPSVLPSGRDKFFRKIKENKTFNKLVFQCCPKQCLVQDVKNVLIKMKIITRE